MSASFDVREWASRAGIQTTGGFAVVAECVTLDELQRFAQIAMESAAIELVKKNNRLDCIATELQDTCHKQAKEIERLRYLINKTYYINEAGCVCQRLMDNLLADVARDVLEEMK